MKNANKITLYNVLCSVILQGLTFFTAPIISRMLGPEHYGIASVYTTWVSVIAIVFGLQTQSTIAVSMSEYKGDTQNRYQSSVLFLTFIAFLSGTGIVLFFLNPISRFMGLQKTVILFMLLQSFGQACISFVNIKNIQEFGAKKNFYLTLTIAFSTTLLSVGLIYVLPESAGYWGRILGLAIPYTTIGVVLFVYILLKGRTFYNREFWSYCLPLCLPIVLHNLSGMLLNQSDRIMLQKMSPPSAVGIYSLACSFGAVLSAVWNALNNSWVPFYYSYMRSHAYEELMNRARNYMELFSVLTMGFLLLSKEVFYIFADKSYWSGLELVFLFALGYYFIFLYSFPVNFEFYNKKTKLIATGTSLAAISNIILNLLMIRWKGAFGAALATCIAHFMQFMFHHIIASKYVAKDEPYCFKLRILAPYTLAVLCVFAVNYLLQDIWYVRWGLAVFIGMLELSRILSRKAIF